MHKDTRRPLLTSKKIFMGWRLLLVGAIFSVLTLPLVHAAPGINAPTPVGPYLDGAFPSLSPGANPNGLYKPENYFPELTFVEPIRIVEHPTADELAIVSKDGTIRLVPNIPGATNATMLLDLSSTIQAKLGVGEGGIGGFIFHPEFDQAASPNRGYVYVWYRWSPDGESSSAPTVDGYQRLSRFELADGASQIDITTEVILIQQFDREQWHIGGAMFFGQDGFLYLSLGDEGNCCDRLESTQKIDGGFFSGILRIDVNQDPILSHPIRRQPENVGIPPSGWPNSFSQNYYVPNNNPFINTQGEVLEEFYAIGLRHPWTIHRDDATGNIWAADVGQVTAEEINVIQKGGNYQWAYLEGTYPGVIIKPQNIIGTEYSPIFEYDRSLGQAVIGAGVYRGSLHPQLDGKYLFSDFLSGKLWTVEGSDPATAIVEEIGDVPAGFPLGINSYLLDRHGRILMAQTAGGMAPGGTIQALSTDSIPNPEPPSLLSQTNAFSDLDQLTAHQGCLPYDLNEPFWSDGAIKFRWICLPNDGSHNTPNEKIIFSENEEWSYPVGTVYIKHFELLLDQADLTSNLRLETRFMVHGADGWYAVTYRWFNDQTDAELLTTGADQSYAVDHGEGPVEQIWRFPSRSECLQCHSINAGSALGVNTRQLNGNFIYPLGSANQLETWNHLEMFDQSFTLSQIESFQKSYAHDDLSASIEDRARSYLDSNCGYCHRPSGVRANFDARSTTPLSQQGLLFGQVIEPFAGGDKVFFPNDPSRSVAYLRMDRIGEGAMPPLAKAVKDDSGIALIEEWLDSAALVGNTTSTDAPFLDAHHPSLYINESDTLSNIGSGVSTVTISDFMFYARKLGNPITPIIFKVNGDNQFTVVAIGTSRTQNQYVIGENRFPFSDSGLIEIELMPSEILATGFMDAFPDGDGWGAGTVIPAISGDLEDEIWALLPAPLIPTSVGFDSSADTPAVFVGEDPILSNTGKALAQYTALKRSYRYSIVMAADGESVEMEVPPLIINGSFESPSVVDNAGKYQYYSGAELPGWEINGDVDLITNLIWLAPDGNQQLDLNGTVPSSISQTVSNLIANGTYMLSFEYARHAFATSAPRTMNLVVNGQLIDSLSSNSTTPNYLSASYSLQANDAGEISLLFASTTSGGAGMVLDKVELVDANTGDNTAPSIAPIADQNSFEGQPVELQIIAIDANNDILTYSSQGLPAGLSINSQTGLISGIPDIDSAGVYSVTLVVSDNNGGDTTLTLQWNVSIVDVNSLPVISAISNQTSLENQAIALQVSASDADNDTLTYSAQGLPPSLFINSQTGLISGNIQIASSGVYAVTVSVSDGNGGVTNELFEWSITNNSLVNGSFESPTVTNNGGKYQYYSGADIPGWQIGGSVDLVTNLIWPAPEGTQQLDLNGTASGSITQSLSNLVANGFYTLSFEYARHAFGANAPRTMDVFVNGTLLDSLSSNSPAPNYLLASYQVQATNAGDISIMFASSSTGDTGIVLDNVQLLDGNNSGNMPPVIAPIADQSSLEEQTVALQVMATDDDNDILSYTAQGLPHALSIDNQTGLISGALDLGSSGIYLVTVTVLDGNRGIANTSFQWSIASVDVNTPPVVELIPDQNSLEGQAVTLQVAASDADNDILTYTAQGLPPGLSIDSQTGLISGTLNIGFSGIYSVTVSVSDSNGGAASEVFQWNITNASINLVNGSFESPIVTNNGGKYQFYSGAELPGWQIDGNIDLVSNLIWAAPEGKQQLDLNGTASGSITQTVSNLVANGFYLLSFEYTRHAFGTSSPRTMNLIVNGQLVDSLSSNSTAPNYLLATYQLQANGAGEITLTFDSTTSGSAGMVIDDVRLLDGNNSGNTPPVIAPIANQSSLEEQTIALQIIASDEDNDALTYSANSLPSGLSINSQTGLISGTLDIGSSGIYQVTVSVSDSNGANANLLFQWTVGLVSKVLNGNFETDGALPPTTSISGWTVLTGDVEVIANGYKGGYALDLNGTTPGSITQTIADLTPGVAYMLDIVWADQLARDQSLQTLASADIFIDGQYIASMRTTSDAFYIDCNAFPFIPSASAAELEIRSTTPSNVGLRIDNVGIRQGVPVAPPASSLNFTNGGFETPLDPPNRDPHVCGFDLPGWLVTQENVDVIALATFGAPEGNAMIDVGGHGPGGIAQTITDLTAGQTYQLSFQYARHRFWDQEPVLSAQIIIDGIVMDTLFRDQTQKAPAWDFYSLDFVAPSDGSVTIEFRSTALTVGGGVLFDNIAISAQ